ncbi:MAG: pyroglutamyl-peptidase I [Bryobacteraceae bacterium]|jgi:pyroglutamyl-peptidase
MILTTAFNPFGGAATNASEVLLRALEADAGVVKAVLETEYHAAGSEIVRLIRDLHPEAVICFGVADGERAVRLEQVARNWDATPARDNAGDVRIGQTIVPVGPDRYLGTLPYRAIAAELGARDIPYLFSEDAGGFVCNHTFYRARHEIEESGLEIPCGFIHVPSISAPRELATFLEAMRTCIYVVVRHTGPRLQGSGV